MAGVEIDGDDRDDRREIFEEAADHAYEQLGSLRRVILNDIEASKFAEARREMSRRLRADEELRESYRANIAMMIFDRTNSEPTYIGDGQVVGQPYDLTNIEYCNAIADEMLRLIFDS